jgi:hypothetical protein
VCAAHDFVVRPAVAVGVFPGAVFAGGHTMALRKCLFWRGEVAQSVKKVAHRVASAIEFMDEIGPQPLWNKESLLFI